MNDEPVIITKPEAKQSVEQKNESAGTQAAKSGPGLRIQGVRDHDVGLADCRKNLNQSFGGMGVVAGHKHEVLEARLRHCPLVGAAEPDILLVVKDSDSFITSRQLFYNGTGLIGTSIVYEKDFIICEAAGRCLMDLLDGRPDVVLFV